MATPNNPQIVTRNQLRRLGITLDDLHDETDTDNLHLNNLFHSDNLVNMADNAALIRSLQGLRTLAISLPKFDGTSTNIDDWLEDFDRYTHETGRETDDNKLYDLISHLSGDARQWFQLLTDDQKTDYNSVRTAIKDKFKPTPQEILDIRGQIYTMRQGPHQSFKEFARTIQLKAKTIGMQDAEIVGICINGARPTIKAHLSMAQPASMGDLLKLPVVVSDIEEEPQQYTMSMLQDINNKVNMLASVHNVQPQAAETTRHVTFRDQRSSGRRSQSQSPARYRSNSYDPVRSPVRQNTRRGQDNTGPRQHPIQARPQQQYYPRGRVNDDQQYRTTRGPRPRPQQQSCGKCTTRCMGGQHCPAFNKQCFRCGGYNHFKSACRSRSGHFNGQ